MLSKNFQVIYQPEPNDSSKIYWLYEEEAKALKDLGLSVTTCPDVSAKKLIYRGGRSTVKKAYEEDSRYVNDYKHVIAYNNMSKYFPHIDDLSIETFFVEDLNKNVEALIKEKGWIKAFIKKDIKSLEHLGEGKSIWPCTSFKEMKTLYNKMRIDGKYAIRKFIEQEVIEREERYWVLNGNIYHRLDTIPNVVKEAAKRLNKLGSSYYTIDATPEFVVEVNSGESSDRHAVNSAELFAGWIKKEFA